ncbi:Cytochrome b-c1 complex subunit Rieske-1, mitochondrial [Tetrabaena socialis]|uniref:quinol--cytochrome-c reductase n=1 Tax=Tetrabaena socialis TaxID=47790 RepID=A0A2J8A5B8_9CHLO|nr:Cytochrome b-c1 complex subunit Rieske-1, mitochondrial [Tetrabaena socialis]|eukprot:PNH07732.1 Cytochrome b-c1 complex subunit Rieske-1, mitochondrial [Tetrabaena socialis]
MRPELMLDALALHGAGPAGAGKRLLERLGAPVHASLRRCVTQCRSAQHVLSAAHDALHERLQLVLRWPGAGAAAATAVAEAAGTAAGADAETSAAEGAAVRLPPRRGQKWAQQHRPNNTEVEVVARMRPTARRLSTLLERAELTISAAGSWLRLRGDAEIAADGGACSAEGSAALTPGAVLSAVLGSAAGATCASWGAALHVQPTERLALQARCAPSRASFNVSLRTGSSTTPLPASSYICRSVRAYRADMTIGAGWRLASAVVLLQEDGQDDLEIECRLRLRRLDASPAVLLSEAMLRRAPSTDVPSVEALMRLGAVQAGPRWSLHLNLGALGYLLWDLHLVEMALRRAVATLLPRFSQPAAETLGPAANHAANCYAQLLSGPLDLAERAPPSPSSFRSFAADAVAAVKEETKLTPTNRLSMTPTHLIKYDEHHHTRFAPGTEGRPFAYFVLTGGRFLYASAARLAVLKIVLSLSAAADTMAVSSIEVDLSNVEEGSTITVKWRGKPVFIRHRTDSEIAQSAEVALSELRDPQKDVDRAVNPKYLVVVGICTHLGCVPIAGAGNYQGWFCPCHGSHYDISGRIREGPAPYNLEVPEYRFVEDKKVIIG